MHVKKGADLAGQNGHSAWEQTFASRLLIAVGVGYLVAQLALVSVSRPAGWDELVYLSQVMPGMDLAFFEAWRARGIPLLVAPVALLGGSVGDVRLFLMVASAVAMTATFRVWIPLIGLAAPVAAVLFSFSWLGLLNGSEVMPNLWAALLGLATAGLIARHIEGGNRLHGEFAVAVLAAMALVRPTEATVVAGAIGLYIVVFRRAQWRLLFLLGLGLVLGWIPWFIEMSVRFGGPMNALDEAAVEHFATASIGHNVFIHLAATGGDLTVSRAPVGGLIWWGLLVALPIVAVAGAGRTDRAAATLGSIGALALGTEYVVFVSALAPRFLLPAYGLASVPAAIGLVRLIRGSIVPRAVGVFVLALLIPWSIWQGRVAHEVEARRTILTIGFRDVGLAVRRLAHGRPCLLTSPHGHTQIAVAARCDEAMLLRSPPSAAELEDLRSNGKELFVILKKPAPRASGLGFPTPVRVPGPGKAWFIYHVDGSG